MESFILALDQGTTSSRAIVFDRDGRVRGVGQIALTQYFPHPAWVEHDPAEIWGSTLDAARDALRHAEIDAHALAAIGITNQRETTLLWDRASGEPLHRAIVWQDRRTAADCERLIAQGHADTVARKTGLLLDPYFAATKIAWMLDNIPGARERAQRGELAFGTVDSWLIHKLTGGAVHATDYTNASRTLLFDLRALDWDEELLSIFGVPRALLPELRPCAAEFGRADASLFGAAVPIRGVAGDQQAD